MPDSTTPFHHPVVWVTGASRGIGREIAKQFAHTGCFVCVSARSRRALTSLVSDIRKEGGRARAVPCDIAGIRAVPSVVRSIATETGPVDVLVNNAGITTFKTILETSIAECESIIRTNLLGPIACTKAVLPSMIQRKKGWIFNILSSAAVKTFEKAGLYAASKSGLYAFGKVLREEMRRYGIKVVNVIPGPTETGMWNVSARRKYSSRMMKPTSVAETILEVYRLPPDVVIDEIMLRPLQGDID